MELPIFLILYMITFFPKLINPIYNISKINFFYTSSVRAFYDEGSGFHRYSVESAFSKLINLESTV